MPRSSNRPALSAASAMTTMAAGNSSAIADHGTRRLSLPAEFHRKPEVDQHAEMINAVARIHRSKNEPGRFAAGHRVRLGPLGAAEQAVKGFHGLAEVRAEQWRYVTEQDAGFREIGEMEHVAGK